MKNYIKSLVISNSKKLFILSLILFSPFCLFAAGGEVPAVGPIRVEFIIFGLILLGGEYGEVIINIEYGNF